ncbi:hypothetical protein LPJ78_006003, partial [Coemansia sp. RSA 989]
PTLSLPPSSSSLPSSSLSAPATPNQTFGNLAEVYRPSGSPIRVTGTKVVTDVSFTDTDATGICKVDKSLVCKGFWDSINKAARICLPRRSEYLLTIPDTIIDDQDIPQMDLATKCRLKRERLFEDSLLKKLHPKFYHEHFMKYPVLNISFRKCKGESFGDFIINLCGAIAAVAQQWLDNYHEDKSKDSPDKDALYKCLNRIVDKYGSISFGSGSSGAQYTNLAI